MSGTPCDVVIVGGGPAGLSAALILARARRRVVVCDAGRPRNASASALHGFLTRDGIPPLELRRLAREELARYDTIEILDTEVRDATCESAGFSVVLADGRRLQSRKLLLATGVVDHVPEIEGLQEMYGRSVFHCPYCDGWEVRDRPLAIYGRGERGAGLSFELTGWSRDLVLVTDGPSEIEPAELARLRTHGIAVDERRVARLEGRDRQLERIVFREGPPLPRHAMFFTTGQSQHSALTVQLGCRFNDKGTVRTGPYETTHLPGLYVAGDASRAVQWVVVAASEGAEAAYAISQALLKEDLAAGE
ncbi:MAG TPA: NAD(P)/FAD-dependent oxidoreductase [Vicinamibacterales bacterium]|nr:NAD(P)/FAD-dependent oxidoreductase [Vicinamibacterales bacterium]